MIKERVSPQFLVDLITKQMNVDGLQIAVREDHAYGWMPTIIASPGNTIGFQRRIDEIAQILRRQFDLAR